MRFEVETTPEDYQNFLYYVMWYAPEQRGSRILYRILYGIGLVPVFLIFASLTASEHMKTNFALTAFYFGIVAFVVGFLASKGVKLMSIDLTVNKIIKNSRVTKFFDKVTYVFEEDFLEYLNDVSEGKIYYKGIEKIINAKNHYFIYLSSYSALVIPKSTFKTTEQEEEFHKIVERIDRKYLS